MKNPANRCRTSNEHLSLLIISAPFGSGKSTLVNEIKRLVDRLEFSVSYTTRPPRGSEENGREYYYTSREVFERMINEGRIS